MYKKLLFYGCCVWNYQAPSFLKVKWLDTCTFNPVTTDWENLDKGVTCGGIHH